MIITGRGEFAMQAHSERCEGEEEICDDGIDNNCNGQIDCNEFSCRGGLGNPPHPHCAPTPTPLPTPSQPCPNPIGTPPANCSGATWNPYLCRWTCFISPGNCGSDLAPVIDGNQPQPALACVDCTCHSPILIDVQGNGFDLTDAAQGVNFDLNGNLVPERLAWTSVNSDDAWLVLDINSDGQINNGGEMFGNYTYQPSARDPNGFLALALYDQLEHGGNGNGAIERSDGIFRALRLWQDQNHNAYSEPWELRTLSELGLARIDLDYHESRRRDNHGNWFRFRAKVKDVRGAQLGRWAWDVYLQSQ